MERSRDEVGAFCAHEHLTIPGDAGGPLAGLTFAVKDVFAIEGITACFGNPTWLTTHAKALHTAPAVADLVASGATMAGLTLTDELALSLTGENHHFGTPINVRCPERVPGGSSSGSAAAVAAGLVDFALGTDTGGSVRVPASHCGIFGVRPSHGAVSCAGVLPLAPRFDTVGWFARDPAVLARVGDVLLPPGPPAATGAASARPPRLLFPRDLDAVVDPWAFRAFERAAHEMSRRLARPLVPATIGDGEVPLRSWLPLYLALQNAEAHVAHGGWIRRERPRFGSLIAGRFARALAAPAADSAAAEAQLAALGARAAELLGGGDWLLWPSAAGAAPRRGLPDDVIDAVTGRSLTLNALASLAGLPQVSVPFARADGCPLGVSLIGARGTDRALLAAVASLALHIGGPS